MIVLRGGLAPPGAHNAPVRLPICAAGVKIQAHGLIGQVRELFGGIHPLVNQKCQGAPPNTNTILNLFMILIRRALIVLVRWERIEERRN